MTQLRSLPGRKQARTKCKALAMAFALFGAFVAEQATAVLPGIVLYLPPVAPILRTPGAGQTIETNYNDARPTLVWRHGALYFGYPRPMSPTHFAVCIFGAAAPITCTYAASAWTPAVGSIPSVPSGSQLSGIPGEYEYTFQLPTAVPATLLDKPIRWSVGACVVPASGTPPACTFALPVDLWLSTKNFVPDSVSASSSRARNLYFEATAKNTGTSEIAGPYLTEMTVYNTLMTAGELCLKDPNDAVVKPTDQVMTSRGRFVTVSTLAIDAQGRRVAPADGVAAIYRPTAWHGPYFGLLPPPGAATVPAGAQRTVAALAIQAPNTLPIPSAYTVLMTLDIGNAVHEFDETDNAKAQCHVIH